jgi:hypothetical protein
MDYRVLTEAERKYTYSQSQQLSMQTGLIGYLRADFGSTGNEFWTTWNDFRKDLKTDEFKAEFDGVINGTDNGLCRRDERHWLEGRRTCPHTIRYNRYRNKGNPLYCRNQSFCIPSLCRSICLTKLSSKSVALS